MDKMTAILDRLIDLTREEKLEWFETADQEGFIATVGTLGVIVRHLGRQESHGDDRHKFEILNRNGRVSDTLETDDIYGLVPEERTASAEQALAMARLYPLARRSALDAESTLEELVHELDAIA